MVCKKKKIKLYILPVIIVLAAGLFALNLYLTNKLERYLKKELIERTAAATNGFYQLSFDKLSISFFKGELKIQGIRFKPDSAVFQKWKTIDSLPQTYIKARIDVIDFKGVNLTWRWNYKHLYFNSFEVKSPKIQLFSSLYSSKVEKEVNYIKAKTLYELISPYINILSVKELNLENASVSYTIENTGTPIVYALDNVNFHAYKFRLDSGSYANGKLLYCNNFDFVTNQPQTLVTNNDFVLKTDSIQLSTNDSVIYIKNISVIPQQELWAKSNYQPNSYIECQIKTVEVLGIHFRRQNALSYLTAKSFDIISSDIKAYRLTNNSLNTNQSTVNNNQVITDSLVQSLSLYEIISPVLHRVSISRIGIEETQLEYLVTVKDSVERFSLNSFSFQANDFLIDSLSQSRSGLGYIKNFAFEANGVNGYMAAWNHQISIDRMALDTERQTFIVNNIHMKPITTRTRNDYMSGKIDTLLINGLRYDKGISATLFKIISPRLYYYKTPSTSIKSTTNNQIDINGIFNPLLKYLSINKIDISKASIDFHDKSIPHTVTYKLNNFNFVVTNFLINENTGKNNKFFFSCDGFGFNFSNFDNYLPDKTYRLSIRNGMFSTTNGMLRFKDVALIPQKEYSLDKHEVILDFYTPLIKAHGFHYPLKSNDKNIRVKAFSITSPKIDIKKNNGENIHITTELFNLQNISGILSRKQLRTHIESVTIGCLTADKPQFISENSNQTLQLITSGLNLTGMKWNRSKENSAINLTSIDILYPSLTFHSTPTTEKENTPFRLNNIYTFLNRYTDKLSIGKFNIYKADAYYSSTSKDNTSYKQKLDTTNLQLDGLKINSANHTFSLNNIRFNTGKIEIPLDNGFYTLKVGKIDLDNQKLNLDSLHLIPRYPKMEFAYKQPKHKDWFDVQAGNIALSGIDLPFYFSDKILKIENIAINNAILQNFKNRKIEVTHYIMPMIYSGLQKAPVNVDFGHVDINNMNVIYEELAPKGITPGKLFFTDMNGKFSGFTNIVTRPNQYITLNANGNLMGKGHFDAVWMLPVDSLNDCFLLNARLESFDLTEMNQLITPLAFVRVESGRLNSLTFNTAATSKNASVDMLFLYNNLKIDILKDKNSEITTNKLYSRLANLVIKKSNPSHPGKRNNKPREVNASITRNPYHSTFNYLWQIIRPPLAESVGISQTEQKAAKGITSFISKVKKFLGIERKKKDVTTQTKETKPSGK